MAHKVKNTFSILFVGDVVGKIGRKTVAKVLPELKEEFQPDLVIANAENLAHGKGITSETLKELLSAGVDFCTGGNHTFAKDEVVTLLGDGKTPLIRPANFPPGSPGEGSRVVSVGSRNVLIINLLGRVFMKDQVDDPYAAFDAIYAAHANENLAAVVVDFHAETTSEKVLMGWYTEGRTSAVVGTHTHVPTADCWVLPGGTAYVSDLGMCGGRDTSLGIDKDHALRRLRSPLSGKFEPPESGHCRFNAVLVEIDPTTRKAVNIERLDRDIYID
ncbi:MAG: TIGR00282 family metallophosphoesterase [Candidatus Kerfeldbacteria bacterium]|nr:TIGR00282 family metallophosphoesterase [Candidatus Kerfeldbacteria bacterium]